jgi:hypothetical protein
MAKGFLYNTPIAIDACEVSTYRLQQNKHKKSFLISVSGGLGDRVCAEPAIRWFIKRFPDYEYSIVSQNPELFSHLPVKNLSPQDNYDFDNNNVLVSMWHDQAISHSFYSILNVHPVDYASLNLFQSILPSPEDKVIENSFDIKNHNNFNYLLEKPLILVHPGISWKTKSFPYSFWDEVLKNLSKYKDKYNISIIGSTNQNRMVGVYNDLASKHNVLDLINKTSVSELGALLKEAKAVITNDSSPIHLASAKGGKAKIAYISIVKSDAYLNHYRVDENGDVKFGWRMKNFANRQYGDKFANPLNRLNYNAQDFLTLDQIKESLPDPEELINWVID